MKSFFITILEDCAHLRQFGGIYIQGSGTLLAFDDDFAAADGVVRLRGDALFVFIERFDDEGVRVFLFRVPIPQDL